MISRRSLFGLTFGGAVASAVPVSSVVHGATVPAKPEDAKPSAPPMRITIGQHGRACKVEVGGVDISRYCRGARIDAWAGEFTRLELDMVVPAGAEIVAEPGVVDVQAHDPQRRIRIEGHHVSIKADE